MILSQWDLPQTDEVLAFTRNIAMRSDDISQLGGFADYLEENHLPSLAYAYRWMMFRGIYPHDRKYYFSRGIRTKSVPQKFRWAWYQQGFYPSWKIDRERMATHAFLPPVLARFHNGHRFFDSHSKAVKHVALMLHTLRKEWSLEPEKITAENLFQ